MTSNAPFPHNITEIDTLTRPDHHFLTTDDACYYLGEYTARKGYTYSETNNLILNLKKSMDTKGTNQWPHKRRAIISAATALRNALPESWLQTATFVPIPPSKAKNDPLYDPRMTSMLQRINTAQPVDVREIIVQTQSTVAVHNSVETRNPEQIKRFYISDEALLVPPPHTIIICDDVLTTGAHFKAAQALLAETFPGVPMVGVFIARRAPESIDFEAIFDNTNVDGV